MRWRSREQLATLHQTLNKPQRNVPQWEQDGGGGRSFLLDSTSRSAYFHIVINDIVIHKGRRT